MPLSDCELNGVYTLQPVVTTALAQPGAQCKRSCSQPVQELIFKQPPTANSQRPNTQQCKLSHNTVRDALSIDEIFAMSDDQLFSKINSNSLHILQQFMPDRPSLNYSLRARPHNKTLIAKTTQLNNQDFIIRSIYKDLY